MVLCLYAGACCYDVAAADAIPHPVLAHHHARMVVLILLLNHLLILHVVVPALLMQLHHMTGSLSDLLLFQQRHRANHHPLAHRVMGSLQCDVTAVARPRVVIVLTTRKAGSNQICIRI